jgi:tRNA U38,U39,U40 pseudouridine synthase TruA
MIFLLFVLPVQGKKQSTYGAQVTSSCPGDLVLIVAQADGFLYKMLRSIVGTLVEVGRGALTPQGSTEDILVQGDSITGGPYSPTPGS